MLKLMQIDPYYQRQKASAESVDFSDVQIMHKFAGRVTRKLNFKVMMFLNDKYLEHNSRPIQDSAIVTRVN